MIGGKDTGETHQGIPVHYGNNNKSNVMYGGSHIFHNYSMGSAHRGDSEMS